MKRVSLAVLALLTATMLAIGAGVASISARTAVLPATQTDLLKVVPDASALIVVEPQRVLSSNLFSQDKLKNLLAKAQTEVSQLGFQMSDLSLVAITFSSAKFNDPTVAVSGTFNQADILARLRDNSKIKFATEKYKGFDVNSVTETGKTDAMAFAFLDATTVVAGSSASVRSAIDVRGGEKPSVAQNAKLMEGISQNASSAIRFALNVTPEMTKSLESSGLPLPSFSTINLIFGGLDMSDPIAVNATLRNDTADNAKAMADQLNSLFSLVKGLLGGGNDPKMKSIMDAVKTVQITSTDIDVKVTGSVPVDIIGQLFR